MARKKTDTEFRGFRRPTTTPIPDEVFDELLPDLTGAELKVLLYICRRTFGFKKDSDNISLGQMVNGIVTKGGKVLDRGTGLGKASVARAVKGLEKKRVILRTRRRSRRKGDEPTTYSLNIIPVSHFETPPGTKMRHPPVSKSNTQQTVLQQTDVVVIEKLIKLKIEKEKAQKLATKFSPEYINQKIEFLEWKLDPETKTPGRPIEDPAGWLIRAIERDYKPPPAFKTRAEREKEAAEAAQAEAERERRRQELREKEERQRAQKLEELKEKHGTTKRELALWQQALKEIELQTTKATYQTWFPNTVLLSVKDSVALIGVPNKQTQEWLEGRLSGLIKQTLEGLVEQPLELKFEILSA